MNNNLLYTVEDKPPFGLSLLLAAQHLLAALGGIIAVPLVIGNVLKLPTEDTMWGSDNICIERNKKIWREKMR